MQTTRDRGRIELWEDSLQRSLAQRAEPRRISPEYSWARRQAAATVRAHTRHSRLPSMGASAFSGVGAPAVVTE